jgi:hypothetical protein
MRLIPQTLARNPTQPGAILVQPPRTAKFVKTAHRRFEP